MRRWRIAGLVLVVAVAISGCTGIPSSGSVQPGDVINDNVDPAPGFLPSGPTAGSTQTDILRDFMTAVTNPTNNYETARQFLSAGVKDSWNPNQSVTIRSGEPVVATVSESEMTYSVTTQARIDDSGRYFAEVDRSTEPLPFTFVQEEVAGNKEWRINSLADGIVLSSDNFDGIFSAYPLYFFDPSYRYLVPDTRWFPVTNLVTTRITSALLGGPSSWLKSVVLSAFPVGTKAGSSVTVVSGTATVDLSAEAQDTDQQTRDRMRQQLIASFGELSTVSSIAITVNGVDLALPANGPANAVKQPTVSALPLIRAGDTFGFVTGPKPTSLDGFGSAVISVNPVGATATPALIAARAADGIYTIRPNGSPQKIDARTGLADPSIDSFGYVWSVQAASLASLTTFDSGGAQHRVTLSSLDPTAKVVSMEISGDGTRILFYLQTSSGPYLGVAGIVRQGETPVGLGEVIAFPISTATPIDATWIDSRTIAVMYATATKDAQVTGWEVGGPSVDLGTISGGISLTSLGDGGVVNLRALSSDGSLYRQGRAWRNAGIEASFIATQQPG